MSYGFQNNSNNMNNIYYGNNGTNRTFLPAQGPTNDTGYQNNYMGAPMQNSLRQQVFRSYNDQIQHRITNQYPSQHAAIQGSLLILCGLALIGLNIAMLVYKPDMYEVPIGFIAGVYFLVLAFFTIIIIQQRKFNLYYTMNLLYQLELIIIAPCTLVVASIGAAGFKCEKPDCSPYNIKLHAPVAAIGGFGSLLCLIFLIILFQKIGSMKNANCQVGPSN